MMFNLHKITTVNFRSYVGAHEFEFPTTFGLYYFTGHNTAEPALGANGVGKSTLLDAIMWVLFGRTTRGLKGDEVLSWGSNSCHVILKLTVGKDKLIIKRTQKPNGICLNGRPLDQAELEKHIRLNFDSFLRSVINSQFNQSFLSKTPSEKLNLFSDILNLDFWLRKSEEAATLSLKAKTTITVLGNSIQHYEGQILTVENDIINFKKEVARFVNNQQVKITIKEKEIDKLSDVAISLSDKLVGIETENHNRLKRLEALRDCYLDDVKKAARERAECLGKIKALDDQVFECSELGDECPVCQQTIDDKHLRARILALKLKISSLAATVDAIQDDLEMYRKLLVQTNMKIDSVIDRINEAKDKKAEAKVLKDKILNLQDELKEIKLEENPYKYLVADKQKKLADLKDAHSKDTKAVAKAEVDFESYNFWIKGFKQVRLFIIEQAFRTLELEVNNSLTQLGMQDWQITFDVERENKSGGITKGFVVFVKGPSNAEAVRWENWSGGETQRLQLAGDLGLANLIMQQKGLSNSIEFFDEPSTHLSPEGMIDLANMLHERAINEHKQIWIVDHASITNFGEFEAVITVEKDAKGSKIRR